MPNQPQLRLSNPFTKHRVEDRYKVCATIDPAVGIYLFKRILTEQGQANALIATFFLRFYEECIRRRIGMRPGNDDPQQALWNEDCEHRAAEIMRDLNFNPPTTNAKQQPRVRRNPSPAKSNRRDARTPAPLPVKQSNADADDAGPTP